MQTQHSPQIEHLAVFTTKTFRGKLQVVEYVDVTTGEILPAEVVQKMGVRSIRPDASHRRLKKLDALRKEPREFADFLLQFRNQRCGFLLPLEGIVDWYATMTRKQPNHVRRYFVPLAQAGILDTDQMLHKDFMIHNPRAGKEQAQGERLRAYNILDSIRKKYETGNPSTF